MGAVEETVVYTDAHRLIGTPGARRGDSVDDRGRRNTSTQRRARVKQTPTVTTLLHRIVLVAVAIDPVLPRTAREPRWCVISVGP